MCYGTMCWSCKSCDKQIRKKGPTGAWIFATWRIVQCAFRKKSVYKLRDQVSIQINTVRSHTRVCAVIFRLPNVNGVSDFNRLLGNGWCNLNYSNGGPFWPILDKMFFFFGRIFFICDGKSLKLAGKSTTRGTFRPKTHARSHLSTQILPKILNSAIKPLDKIWGMQKTDWNLKGIIKCLIPI